MPIDVTYDKDLQILRVKLTGVVSLDEMTDALMRLVTSSDIPSDVNALWDVSEMEFTNITIDFQRELIKSRKQNEESRGNAKIAILCTYALAEPLVKLYTILSEELIQQTKMFRIEQEAIDWLQAS